MFFVNQEVLLGLAKHNWNCKLVGGRRKLEHLLRKGWLNSYRSLCKQGLRVNERLIGVLRPIL